MHPRGIDRLSPGPGFFSIPPLLGSKAGETENRGKPKEDQGRKEQAKWTGVRGKMKAVYRIPGSSPKQKRVSEN